MDGQVGQKIEDHEFIILIVLLNLKDKFNSFGWNTIECDGNDFEDLIQSIDKAKVKLEEKKPVIIIMKTIMGKGVDFMENTHKWHGIAPDDKHG